MYEILEKPRDTIELFPLPLSGKLNSLPSPFLPLFSLLPTLPQELQVVFCFGFGFSTEIELVQLDSLSNARTLLSITLGGRCKRKEDEEEKSGKGAIALQCFVFRLEGK